MEFLERIKLTSFAMIVRRFDRRESWRPFAELRQNRFERIIRIFVRVFVRNEFKAKERTKNKKKSDFNGCLNV